MPMNIHTWADLKKVGINSLTGEACKYNERLLCDLSAEGIELIRDLFGMAPSLALREQFPENWNSHVGDSPALASIMLSREMFGSICRFALFKAGYEVVLWSHDGGWAGYMLNDLPAGMEAEKLQRMYKAVYRNPAPKSDTSRNTHAMTGRQL